MKGITIREFMGDYALDIPMGDRSVYTIYFNSRRNAETVKRIMEVDDSIPNAATVCDMVEVVRCKDCAFARMVIVNDKPEYYCEVYYGQMYNMPSDGYCSWGIRKEQT